MGHSYSVEIGETEFGKSSHGISHFATVSVLFTLLSVGRSAAEKSREAHDVAFSKLGEGRPLEVFDSLQVFATMLH